MANGHGGKRPGAGRKRKADKFEGEISQVEQLIVEALPQVVKSLIESATGALMVREEFEPAGTITRDATQIEHTDNGPRALKVKELVYPDKDPEDLVLVKRIEQHETPEVRAGMYLVDRILGKPTEHIEMEADVSGQIDVDDTAKKEAAKQLSEWREKMKGDLAQALGHNPLTNNPTAPTEISTPNSSETMSESSTTPSSTTPSSTSEPSSSPSASLTRPTSSTPIV